MQDPPDNTQAVYVQHTKNWLQSIVVGLNLCPFAKAEVVKNRIRYIVWDYSEFDLDDFLDFFAEECHFLAENSNIETSLLIVPIHLEDFLDYLDVLDQAQERLEEEEYIGTFQIASFHPQYQFGGTLPEDVSNYTNRAPYPTFHLIREESLERVLKSYKDPENIPKRNVQLMYDMGINEIKALLERCIQEVK